MNLIIPRIRCKGMKIRDCYDTSDTALHLGIFQRTLATLSIATILARVAGSKMHRVISVCLNMLLQVLGALESLATEFTFVRLQGNMDT